MGESDDIATPLDEAVRPIAPPVRDEVLDEDNAERRRAVSSSVIGGFHIAIVRRVPGEPSRSTTRISSSPVRRSANSRGFATVAEASRKRGTVP